MLVISLENLSTISTFQTILFSTMASNVVVPVSMNSASRVFSSGDLFGSIMEFVHPKWVNPFFPSIEGALLEGREELLGQKFELLFRSMKGKVLKGKLYSPHDTYEFRDMLQIVEFAAHYAENYEKYAEGSSFSSILCYLFTPFTYDSYIVSVNEIRLVAYFKEKLFQKLCDVDNVDRILELVQCANMTRCMEFSFEAIYRNWMYYSGTNWEQILHSSLEIIMEELEKRNNPIRDLDRLNRDLHNVFQDGFDEDIHDVLDRIYRIRMNPKYLRIGVPHGISDDFAKVFQYAAVGYFDMFAGRGNYVFLKDCLDCYERLSSSEKGQLSVYADKMNTIFLAFHEVFEDIRERNTTLTNEEKELIPRLDMVLSELWCA